MPDDLGGGWKGRAVEAELDFARGGGRTFLRRQSVPYPFHVTRPHYLDPGLTELATLYLQSASGGLYPGDGLSLALAAAAGSAAHVTSQAATVVNGSSDQLTGRGRASITTRLDLPDTAFLALTTDPHILFPDADLAIETQVRLGRDAAAIIAEGFAVHDPAGAGRPFAALAAATRVVTPEGRALVDDRGAITGAAFAGQSSPLGPYRALGSVLILGIAARAMDLAAIDRAFDDIGVLAGATRLPNDAGTAIRLLAMDGGRLAVGLERGFAIGFEVLLGVPPARRRK